MVTWQFQEEFQEELPRYSILIKMGFMYFFI